MINRPLKNLVITLALVGVGGSPLIAGTTIESALNGLKIEAGGGSQYFWGPMVSQTSIHTSGSANNNYPLMFAGTSISGNGSGVFSNYCSPGPAEGPGTVIAPSTSPVYQWHCNYPVPPLPAIDINYYRALAQSQGNSCAGQSCYNASASPSYGGLYDPSCVVGADPKIWFFEGSPSFSGGTYFCGILVSQGSIRFTGSGAGNTIVEPPANAWTQYPVDTPNGSVHPRGDTAAVDEYPGDAGFHLVKPYNFAAGGGGYTGKQVTFHGYLFTAGGYTTNGSNLIVGVVHQGPNASSSSGGGSTIFFQPQTIFTGNPPPPPPNTVATPVITPDGGNFIDPVRVSITVTTPGAAIHVTLDGSTPNGSSPLYTGPFMLSSNTIVKAIGTLAGMNDSAVATAAFNFISVPHPPPAPLTVTITPSAVALGPSQTRNFNALVGGSGVTNPNVTWSLSPNVGTLSVNSSTFTRYTAPAAITSQQTVTLTAVSLQDNSTFDTATITLMPVAPPTPDSADMSITKTASAPSILVGQNLTYTLTVSNAGPDTAPTVTVTDTLPGSVSLVSRTPSQGGCIVTGATLSCDLGAVSSGAQATVLIVVTANLAGSLTNTAIVDSVTSDPALGNNAASVTTTVLPNGSNVPILSRIEVSPSHATVLMDGTQLFSAFAFDQNNNLMSGTLFNWSVTGVQNSMGPLNGASSTFTAGAQLGSFTVTASSSGINGTATVLVSTSNPNCVLDRITVSPAVRTISPTEHAQFFATAWDSCGQAIPFATFTWSITSNNDGSSISTNGEFVPPTGLTVNRSFTIAATYGGRSGTAQVNVEIHIGATGYDISAAKPFPVPWKSTSADPGVTFTGLAPGTRIRIFTSAGNLVQTLNSDSGAAVLWRVNNLDGERVASGVYYYIIDNGEQMKKGKVVIIQ